MWVASSKSTDLEKPKSSRIYGAVFVLDVLATKDCKRHHVYSKFLGMEQFEISAEFQYQLIIPAEKWARRQLITPIQVPDGVEARWDGVWVPEEDSCIYCALMHVHFVDI